VRRDRADVDMARTTVKSLGSVLRAAGDTVTRKFQENLDAAKERRDSSRQP